MSEVYADSAFSPKPIFNKGGSGEKMSLNITSQGSADPRGYASNVDRVRATGYTMGSASEYDTPSEAMVRGGAKRNLRNAGKGALRMRANQGDDDTDPVLIKLVDEIFDKHDTDLAGVVKWPKGQDMIMKWTSETLGCKAGDPVVDASLSYIKEGESLTREQLLRRLKELKWWKEGRERDEDTLCGEHLEEPEDVIGYPVFPRGQQRSLLCKVLTRDLWRELMGARDQYGYSFREAIFSGCKHPDSAIGVFAGSPDSYAAFGPMMVPLLEDYHKHKLGDGHTTDMDPSHLHTPKFSTFEKSLIKSIKIAVSRNLANYPLCPGIS